MFFVYICCKLMAIYTIQILRRIARVSDIWMNEFGYGVQHRVEFIKCEHKYG